MEKAEYSIYRDASPVDYRGFLECVNQDYFQEIVERIHPLQGLIDVHGACVYLIGSDGKRERHAQSRSELFFLQPPEGELTEDQIFAVMPHYTDMFEVGDDGSPSIKTMGEMPLSYSYGNHHLMYPDTTLNSRFVYGSESLYRKGRDMVFEEMKTRKIYREMKSQRTEYEKSVRSGMSRRRISFCNGKAFYDEIRGKETYGLKPLLRLIQRSLDTHTVIKSKEGMHIDVDLLPSNTPERLEYFGFPEIYVLAYLWTLQQYHFSQELFKESRERVTAEYDKDIFQDVQTLSLRFSSVVKLRQ